jgi:hypothetical protein
MMEFEIGNIAEVIANPTEHGAFEALKERSRFQSQVLFRCLMLLYLVIARMILYW